MVRTGTAAGRAAETEARKRRLLDAAMALADEGGYDAVQMRDVAARAEVALGTLYRHYSSKDQLLLAALAEQARALRARSASRAPAGADAPARVMEVLRRGSRALDRRPRMMAAMVTALSSPDPDAAASKQEVYDEFTAMIATAVGDDAGVDVDAVSRVLGHVWFTALSFRIGGLSDQAQMAADLDTAVRMLLRPT